jgi:hypothetical protein
MLLRSRGIPRRRLLHEFIEYSQRWGNRAQAVLTPRGRDQSDRFDDAWALLAAHYQLDVHVLGNVIPFAPTAPRKQPGWSRKRAG